LIFAPLWIKPKGHPGRDCDGEKFYRLSPKPLDFQESVLDRTFAEEVVGAIGIAFQQAGVDEQEAIRRAAHMSHGMGLPMADAMIASSLERMGCTRLYTRDGDFESYDGPMGIVFL